MAAATAAFAPCPAGPAAAENAAAAACGRSGGPASARRLDADAGRAFCRAAFFALASASASASSADACCVGMPCLENRSDVPNEYDPTEHIADERRIAASRARASSSSRWRSASVIDARRRISSATDSGFVGERARLIGEARADGGEARACSSSFARFCSSIPAACISTASSVSHCARRSVIEPRRFGTSAPPAPPTEPRRAGGGAAVPDSMESSGDAGGRSGVPVLGPAGPRDLVGDGTVTVIDVTCGLAGASPPAFSAAAPAASDAAVGLGDPPAPAQPSASTAVEAAGSVPVGGAGEAAASTAAAASGIAGSGAAGVRAVLPEKEPRRAHAGATPPSIEARRPPASMATASDPLRAPHGEIPASIEARRPPAGDTLASIEARRPPAGDTLASIEPRRPPRLSAASSVECSGWLISSLCLASRAAARAASFSSRMLVYHCAITTGIEWSVSCERPRRRCRSK